MPFPAESPRVEVAAGHGEIMTARSAWVAYVCMAATAVYFVCAWASNDRAASSPDTYYYYYPNMLYAVRAIRDAGRGLLWNPLLSCGQPFFAISSTGVLYPANAFFLLFNPDLALRLVTVFNLSVASASTFLLCRYYALGRTAAFCGALAFAYSGPSVQLTSWTPLVASPYAWLPAIVLGCERTLRNPTAGRAVVLALVIAIALLPGFPQTVFFAYQLIALRVAWELVSRRLVHPLATFRALGIALLLPLLLTAIQLLPSLEMVQLGVRGGGVAAQELGGGLTWNTLLKALTFRLEVGNPVLLLPCILASCSLILRPTRRLAVFYAIVGLLYLGLALGPSTPLFAIYQRLPLGSLFRLPLRFLWVTSFCMSVLCAIGVEALVSRSSSLSFASPRYYRYLLALLLLASLIGLHWLHPGGLTTAEWTVASAAVVAAICGLAIPATRAVAGITIAAALAVSLLSFPFPGFQSVAIRPFPHSQLRADGQMLAASGPAFAEVHGRLTPNDRVYVVYLSPGMGRGPSLAVGLGPKTAGILGVPAIHDYEPQPALRYASYYTLMRTGRPMRRLNDYYAQFGGMITAGFKRRLLDLAAARYLVVEPAAAANLKVLNPPPVLLWEGKGLQVYENQLALPRAFFVPSIEAMPDAEKLLHRLSDGTDDLRQLALVEETPQSGFVGESTTGEGAAVEFVTNDPENVALRVQAPARGFLHLADQYFPGWSATVNGVPTPIMRGNYMFRLVEVPAGRSVVEFRYRPLSVLLGASVSGLTIVGLATTIVLRRRRPAEVRS